MDSRTNQPMYTITIEKTETKRKLVQGDWVIIEQRPWTQKEMDEAFGQFDPKPHPLKEIRGYPPAREQNVMKTSQVFQQTIEDIDLSAVIMAVNNLAPRNPDSDSKS